MLHTMTCTSPVGDLKLIASDKGLVAVLWPKLRTDKRLPFAPGDVRQLGEGEVHPVLEDAARQLGEYFAGERQRFDVPLDLRGSDFQVEAWRALASIPFGTTATYSQQAKSIGRPKAVRAIGAANGRNPVSVILPCHRVIGANGSLTGFNGGLDVKKFLLDHERSNAVHEMAT